MTPQTLFTSWLPYYFLGESGAEQARCILFDGNRNYPCDAYL